MIQFEHVCKSYEHARILRDQSFTIEDGTFVVLIGPSGCGKTTTLKTINRLIDIDSGTISIDRKDIRDTDKVTLRRHIGSVIQQIGLFSNMTVAQNIAVVPKLLKMPKEKSIPPSAGTAFHVISANLPDSGAKKSTLPGGFFLLWDRSLIRLRAELSMVRRSGMRFPFSVCLQTDRSSRIFNLFPCFLCVLNS